MSDDFISHLGPFFYSSSYVSVIWHWYVTDVFFQRNILAGVILTMLVG